MSFSLQLKLDFFNAQTSEEQKKLLDEGYFEADS